MRVIDESWHKEHCIGTRRWASRYGGFQDLGYCECEQGRALKALDNARSSRMIRCSLSVFATMMIFVAVVTAALVVCSRIVR